ncbi:MAG: ATP-binding cassette domain-containing protein, partial [Gammaproteobacteria bacterium]
MQALDIIQAEHRGMWRVTSALDSLRESMARKQDVKASADTVLGLLEYIGAYVDRVHHPKEDEYLFTALRRRDPSTVAEIERLEAEHRDGPEYLERLQGMARDYAQGRTENEQAFFDALAGFAEHLRAHIRLEETTVMPAARRALTPEDWQVIDAAFLRDEDPLFGAHARRELEALKASIVALAPEPVGLGAQRAAPATAAAVVSAGQPVLQITGIASHYGRIQALHGVDLEVREGQLVALVGANGAGKTTLLRTISGVQPASAGQIRYFGRDITRLAPEKRVRLGICQVPEGRQVFGPMRIEDNLRLGAYTRKGDGVDKDLARMYALFPILEEKRDLPAGTLSGGQQQMLAMARALMGRPRLLLLDEPSMGLAPLLVEEIFRVVKQLKAEGITIFLVEQNAHAALSIAD